MCAHLRACALVLATLVASLAVPARAEQSTVEIPNTPQPELPPAAPAPPRPLDGGGKLAIAGASVLLSVYTLTVTWTPLSDGMCGFAGLREGPPPDCPSHPRMYIPLVGGFLNAADHQGDTRTVGIVSSTLQVLGVAALVSGLVLHHRRAAIVPYVTPGGAGVSGRF